MPKIKTRALTERDITGAKATGAKSRKLVDGSGLFLFVTPNGRKTFYVRLQRGGRDVAQRLGDFPAMSLKLARDAAESARSAARAAPVAERAAGPDFGRLIDDWYRARCAGWKPGYARDVWRRIELNALPALRTRDIKTITRRDIIEQVLEPIAKRGKHVQARRVRALLEDAFDFAINKEWIEANPATKSILKVLPERPKVKPHRAASIEALPAIIGTIRAYPSKITSAALLWTILTAARTTETLRATWAEIDLEKGVWTIPAARMKSDREHRVPLSRQAIAVLESLPRISKRLLFPTLRGDRPMSENGMLYALQGMGFEITVHGFRSTFSTWANDNRIAGEDVIEAALAHVTGGVAGAYDRGTRFEARKNLMQRWADEVLPTANVKRKGVRAAKTK